MSRRKDACRFTGSQWDFLREQAFQVHNEVINLALLKELCQEFWWEFHWYVFPSEMKHRIEMIQPRRFASRQRLVLPKVQRSPVRMRQVIIACGRRAMFRGPIQRSR